MNCDLSTFAQRLRNEGFDARSLGRAGVTIWKNGEGRFISAEEVRQLPETIPLRDVVEILESGPSVRRGATP
ncbi:MAG: hypothetical protein ACE15B_04470 [Bryobacteraceae bacterium]